MACKKPGGTCSFRLYQKSKQTGEVALVAGEAGQLRTFCPKRFEEGAMIYRWVGETVLNCAEPRVLKEIGFLEPPPPTEAQNEKSGESVGRIDKVLIVPEATPVSWCALEVQTVYFSGLRKVPSLRRWGKRIAALGKNDASCYREGVSNSGVFKCLLRT